MHESSCDKKTQNLHRSKWKKCFYPGIDTFRRTFVVSRTPHSWGLRSLWKILTSSNDLLIVCIERWEGRLSAHWGKTEKHVMWEKFRFLHTFHIKRVIHKKLDWQKNIQTFVLSLLIQLRKGSFTYQVAYRTRAIKWRSLYSKNIFETLEYHIKNA